MLDKMLGSLPTAQLIADQVMAACIQSIAAPLASFTHFHVVAGLRTRAEQAYDCITGGLRFTLSCSGAE